MSWGDTHFLLLTLTHQFDVLFGFARCMVGVHDSNDRMHAACWTVADVIIPSSRQETSDVHRTAAPVATRTRARARRPYSCTSMHGRGGIACARARCCMQLEPYYYMQASYRLIEEAG